MKKMILAGVGVLASLPLLATELKPSPKTVRPAQLVGVHRVDSGRARHTLDPSQNEGMNVDVIGRLTGSGGVLFKTSLDVSNNTTDSTRVDFFAELKDSVNGNFFEVTGSIANSGVTSPGGGQLLDLSVAHFDDFIDALRAAGGVSAQEESDGLLGSLVLEFFGFSPALGKASAEARFYSTVSAGNGSFSGGTIGVSANGHEFTDAEPSSLVGIVRNSLGEANTPQIYTNFFICNEGYIDPSVGLTGATVTLRLTGYSNKDGSVTGTLDIPSVEWGQTAVVSDVFTALHGNHAKDDTLLVFVDIVSGNSAISGLSSKNDNVTKDPSAAQLRPADF